MNVDGSGAAALLLLAAGLGALVVLSAWLSARRSGRGPAKGRAGAGSPHPHLLLPGPPQKAGREPLPGWVGWVGGVTVLLVLVAGVLMVRPRLSGGSGSRSVATAPGVRPVQIVSSVQPGLVDTTMLADTVSLLGPGDTIPFLEALPGGALDDVRRLPLEGIAPEPARDSPEAAEPAPGPSRQAAQAEPEPDDSSETEATTVPEAGTEAAVRVHSNTMAAGGLLTCRLSGGAARCWGAAPALRRAGAGGGQAERPLRAVRAGLFDVCGIADDGAVQCWSSQPDRPGFQAGLRSLPGPAVDVAVGAEHACALLADGRVFCWGSNERGQLGGGNLLERSADPVAVTGLPAAVQVSAGWHHTCAVTTSGQAYCWGADGAGQLGDGGSEDRGRPVRVGGPGTFARLSAGSSHTCGLARDGTAWCWGDDGRGQLGIGEDGGAPGPARVDATTPFASLTAGGTHTCALTAVGQAWCWGGNTYGQLGSGTLEDAATPMPVSAGPIRFAELAAGGAHTCGRSTGDEVYCWGNNLNGQLGDGSRDNRLEPVEVR